MDLDRALKTTDDMGVSVDNFATARAKSEEAVSDAFEGDYISNYSWSNSNTHVLSGKVGNTVLEYTVYSASYKSYKSAPDVRMSSSRSYNSFPGSASVEPATDRGWSGRFIGKTPS